MSLSITGAFSNINAVQRLNAEELRLGISGEASWHHQYRDSCYIYISGLDPRLTEGDVAIVFSQWGEPIDIVLVRDQKTGVPRGFGFLGYEDQRSTILAVDNANGMKLLQRTLRVDHCKNFRPPASRKDGEEEEYQPTGAEGAGIGKHLVTKREKELHKSREQQRKLREQRIQQGMARAAAGHKDVDEMWAEEFELMLSNLNEKADAEMSALIKEDKRLKKKLKKEKKLLEKEAKKRSRSSSTSRSRSRSTSVPRRRRADQMSGSSNTKGECDGKRVSQSSRRYESNFQEEQHSRSRKGDSRSRRDNSSRSRDRHHPKEEDHVSSCMKREGTSSRFTKDDSNERERGSDRQRSSIKRDKHDRS